MRSSVLLISSMIVGIVDRMVLLVWVRLVGVGVWMVVIVYD